MNIKTARFRELVDDLNQYLGSDPTIKTAEEQNKTLSEVADVPSQKEVVQDALPEGITVTGGEPGDLTTDKGAPVGEPLPDQPKPPAEKPEKREVSPGTKIASLDDPFMALANEILGTSKAAEGTPGCGSDPEVAEAIPNEGKDNAQVLDTSGNPEATVGAGSNVEQGHEVKTAGLTAEEIDGLTAKVAQYAADRLYGRSVATQVLEGLFGVAADGRKVAAAQDPDGIHASNLAILEERVNAKVAELAANGYTADQIAGEIRKIAEEEGAMAVEEGIPIDKIPVDDGGAPMDGENIEVSEEQAAIVQALQELVEEGAITPEEAMEAADEIDQMVQEGGEPSLENGGDIEISEEQAVIVQALQELVEEGAITPEEAMEAADEIDQMVQESGESGPEDGDGETPLEEAPAEESLSEEEIEEESKKEAALQATPEYRRGLYIAAQISHKVASIREAVDSARSLANAKIATLRSIEPAATDDQLGQTLKVASVQDGEGYMVKVASAEPTVEEAFLAVDHVVAQGFVSGKQAAAALSDLHERGDSRKLAALIGLHNAVVDLIHVKEAQEATPPVDPMAGGAPVDPAGAPAPADPAAGGDPSAAIEQLLGALEQLVALGIIPEEQAVAAVQGMGLVPEEGGGEAAPPAPPAEAPPVDPMVAAPPVDPTGGSAQAPTTAV